MARHPKRQWCGFGRWPTRPWCELGPASGGAGKGTAAMTARPRAVSCRLPAAHNSTHAPSRQAGKPRAARPRVLTFASQVLTPPELYQAPPVGTGCRYNRRRVQQNPTLAQQFRCTVAVFEPVQAWFAYLMRPTEFEVVTLHWCSDNPNPMVPEGAHPVLAIHPSVVPAGGVCSQARIALGQELGSLFRWLL